MAFDRDTTLRRPPAVVYHGTSQPFDRFGPNPAGLFFAEDREKATSYASVRLGPAPRVIQASLTISRPWTLIRYGLDVPYRDQLDQSVPALAAQGYDGIHLPEEGVWVAFSPDQVRILGDERVHLLHRGGMPTVRMSLPARQHGKAGNGDPSTPYDFSEDERFAHLFYGEPTAAEVKAFSNWLRSRPDAFVRLYHGTAAANPIWEQGILPTTLNRRNSLQSSAGFVYLSVFPGMAFDFGRYASLNRPAADDGARVAVYPVTLTIRRLLADLDQLHNRRLWAAEPVGNTLAESLVRARGARHRGRVDSTCIGLAERYIERDVLVHDRPQEARPILKEPVRFSFAGEKARTGDHDRLQAAKAMASAGTTPTVTHRETGWSMGVDGQWRFEIDDSGAQLLPALKSLKTGGSGARQIDAVSYRVRNDGLYDLVLGPSNPQVISDFVNLYGIPRRVLRALVPEAVVMAIDAAAGEEDLVHDFEEGKRLKVDFTFSGFDALPLREVLHHPALFEAYPGLADILVGVDPSLGIGGWLGQQRDGSSVIKIGLGQQLKTLLHEIQHAIQSVEGFARGGSIRKIAEKQAFAIPLSVLDPAISIAEMAAQMGVSVQALRATAPRHLAGAPPQAWALAHIRTRRSLELEHAYSRIASDPVGSYTRLAGEVEARNVMTRADWSEAARKLVPPDLSADVDAVDQLVQMSEDGEIRSAQVARERY